jgi:hypothetical protein
VESPPVCYNGNDVPIGMGQKQPDGHFVITVSPPLKTGQVIYATDGCTDPTLIGPSEVVFAPTPAPALSPDRLLALVGILMLVGAFGLLPRMKR